MFSSSLLQRSVFQCHRDKACMIQPNAAILSLVYTGTATTALAQGVITGKHILTTGE